MFIPDREKLDALHYAFRMRAKHNTPLSTCAKWLHSATGRSITIAGFQILYKKWVALMRKHHQRKIDRQFQDKIATMKELNVLLHDPNDIAAMAHKAAREAWKKTQQSTN